MAQSQTQTNSLRQQQVVSQQQMLANQILELTSLDLRQELHAQMSQNELIEDIVWNGESILSQALPVEHSSDAISSKDMDFDPDGERASETLSADDADRDYLMQNNGNFTQDDYSGCNDPDAQSKRQLMFDRQVHHETLQEHLLAQVGTDISAERQELARLLISYIDGDGYFSGSIPDLIMVSGMDEPTIVDTLHQIQRLDPEGCGARDLREALLAQMDKIDESPLKSVVREVIDRHILRLKNNLTRWMKEVCADLEISQEVMDGVMAELKKLRYRPASAFKTEVGEEEYVKPDVFLRQASDGSWKVRVPEGNMPRIVLSKKYLKMLEDPNVDKETKDHIREKLQHVNDLIKAIEERPHRIAMIAQTIVDSQPDVFRYRDFRRLRPLTQKQVADKVNVDHSVVSRAVRSKYMSTPFGTVELGKLFATGISLEGGETVANNQVMEMVKRIIDEEDKTHPLSDDAISRKLRETIGVVLARRTVAKYRSQLLIPVASDRRC